MSQRLTKELRPLLLPGLIAAVAAIAPLLLSALRSGGTDEALSFFRGVAFFVFVGSIALLACLPFGVEIQERTFPLLLSQPLGRSRLWAEKLLVVVIMAAGLGVLQLVANQFSESSWQLDAHDEFLLVAFFVATICSAGFWTLVARSSIGGTVFTLASQLFSMLVIGYALDKIYGPGNEALPIKIILFIAILYASVLLWLGSLKFTNLELNDSCLGQVSAGESPAPFSRWDVGWLRCQPRGAIANLVRKELRLQKPVLMIAALVSICWLATLGLCWLTPARKAFFEGTGNVLTGVFMVLVPLLAGCISLGEEKVLGLNSWQLTLPVSARKQWLVKLAVGAGIALGLGLVLPCFLSWLSSSTMETGLVQALRDPHRQEALLTVLTVVGLPFLLSFWAATLLANTVRSALMGVAGLVVLFACVALGVWCASKLGGMEAPLLKFVITQFQLAGDSAQRTASEATTIAGYSCVVLGILLVLTQSLAQFRRARVQSKTLVFYAAAVAGFTFLAAFWVVDIQMSNAKAGLQLQTNVAHALAAVPLEDGFSQPVSIVELEQTGRLSGAARQWLRGASVTIQRITVKSSSPLTYQGRQGRPGVVNNPLFAHIRFPNGQQQFIGPY